MTIDTASTDTEICASDSTLEVSALSGTTCSSATQYSSCASGICQKYCKVGTGANCLANTYYLVDTNLAPLASGTGKLFYCTATNTACTEVSSKGYYVNDKDTAFSCDGTAGNCVAASYGASCSGTTIGQLAVSDNDPIICLSSDKSKKLSDDGKYLVGYLASNVFGITDTTVGLVKIENNSVTLVSSTSTTEYIIANETEMTLLAAAGEGTLYSCTAGICTKSTIDATIIGYYKNADTTVPYIKCYEDADGNFKCESIAAPADTVTCGSSTIGQLVKDGKFCLDGTKNVPFDSTTKNYQVSYSADGIFSSTVDEEGKYGIVEVTANTIKLLSSISDKACVSSELVVTDSSSCADGTEECKGFASGACYYDCSTSDGKHCLPKSYYAFSNAEGTTALAATGDAFMYYCETPGSACVAVTDKTGYFVNSDLANKGTVPYIECADSSGTIACKGITAPTGSTCENTTYGTLIIDSTVVKLCLDGTNKVAFGDSDTAKNYLVSYSSANIYNDVIVEEGKYGVVSVNNHAMIINTAFQTDYGICTNTGEVTSGLTSATGSCTTGSKSTTVDFCYGGVCFLKCKVTDGTNCSATTYYLVKDATTSIPVMSSSETGKLYYCKTASAACTAVDDVGYYLNGEKDAYACEKDANNALACKKFSIGSGCTADTIGQPIIDTNKIYFCLNYDASKASNQDTKSGEMTTNMDTNYLLGYKESNIFGLTAAGQYGLVSVKEKTVTLVRKDGKCIEDSTNLNTLAAATNSGKLYQCTAGICSVVPDSDTTLAVGYYKNIGAADTSTTDPEYIAFTTTSTTNNGVTTTTKSYKAIKAGSSCSAIGDIIVESSDFKICLTTSIKVKLDPEGSENGKYFIEVTGANIVFIQNDASNCHAIVIVDNENVYLSGKETGVDRYRYSDDNQKLLDFSEQAVQNAQCNANKELTGTLTEFLLMEESEGDTTNYYEKQS